MSQSSRSAKQLPGILWKDGSINYLYRLMNNAELHTRRIGDLVEQDYVWAYVLYYFGIGFYEYSEKTLEEVCRDKGLKMEKVVQELESPTYPRPEENLPLASYSIDVIIEYLKHAHFIFVKRKLPYISKLVESFRTDHSSYVSIVKDLKTLFPLFVEDFVRHIYEEEHTLFRYIKILERAEQGKYNPSKLFYMMERHSVQRFATQHEAHDDEMVGIRKITADYSVKSNTPLHIRVIYSELTNFEKSLQIHARVENEILFPKAMTLENGVRQMAVGRVKFN